MLVKCPRCEFTQPKDQYCAQCGIDMQAYKPPRKSMLKSYLTDPLTYLAVALVVIGLSIATLYKKEKSTLAQRVSFLKGNLQIASTSGFEKNSDVSEAARKLASEQPAETYETEAAPAGDVAMTTPAMTATAAPTANAKSAVATSGPIVHVYYAEVPRRALEKIYEESQETGQFNSFGDYTAGILPDVAKRIAAQGLKITVLEKQDKNISKAQQLFTGIHDSETGEVIGLNTFIELAEMENNVFRGNLEIVRSWKDLNERAPTTVQKNSYPAVFELNPGAGFFVAGIMPRTRVAHEEELVKQGPFQILKSQSFNSKESEFVIFVEFEKKP